MIGGSGKGEGPGPEGNSFDEESRKVFGDSDFELRSNNELEPTMHAEG